MRSANVPAEGNQHTSLSRLPPKLGLEKFRGKFAIALAMTFGSIQAASSQDIETSEATRVGKDVPVIRRLRVDEEELQKHHPLAEFQWLDELPKGDEGHKVYVRDGGPVYAFPNPGIHKLPSIWGFPAFDVKYDSSASGFSVEKDGRHITVTNDHVHEDMSETLRQQRVVDPASDLSVLPRELVYPTDNTYSQLQSSTLAPESINDDSLSRNKNMVVLRANSAGGCFEAIGQPIPVFVQYGTETKYEWNRHFALVIDADKAKGELGEHAVNKNEYNSIDIDEFCGSSGKNVLEMDGNTVVGAMHHVWFVAKNPDKGYEMNRLLLIFSGPNDTRAIVDKYLATHTPEEVQIAMRDIIVSTVSTAPPPPILASASTEEGEPGK